MSWLDRIPSSVRIVLAAFVAWQVYVLIVNAVRIRKRARLGGYCPTRKSYVLGFDLIYNFIRAYASNSTLEFWFDHFRRYGNPANPWTFGFGNSAPKAVFTADPDNIKAVLATQFEDFGKGAEMARMWRDFLGEGIFTQDGAVWHEARKLIRPQFIKERLSDIRVFEHHTQTLLPMLGGKGETVDLSNLFFRFSLDAATGFLFGRSVDSLHQERATFANAFDFIQRTQVRIISLGQWEWMYPRRKFREELQIIEDFMTPFIDEALQYSPDELQKATEPTFLHALAAHTRDRRFLRDQIVSVLLAGRDTTACTLSWLFYEIAVHPRIVEKLRAEILQQVGSTRPPTYADLKNMRYLQHTINETLRLYPVVPYNTRTALRDTTLPRGGGPDGNDPIGILKGTDVSYATLVLQRRADLYPPAEKGFAPHDEFSPERWDHWTPKSWQYVPFNGGPRICIGQQFALTEMAYTITRVLQRYSRLEYRGQGHPGLHAEIVLSPAQPVLVGFYAAKEQ